MDKLLGMLGLARRAGKVSSGTFICEKAVKSRKAKLVILAKDASENTKKTVTDACSHYGVRCITYSNMAELGGALGTGDRAAAAVNDNNFAKAISDIYFNGNF